MLVKNIEGTYNVGEAIRHGIEVNTGNIAAFIDNVMVVTDLEEGCDELGGQVLKRIKENNLHVNLEKC